MGASTDTQAKKILARSLYNEFVKSGWSRSSIIEYVNIFLDLVITTEGGPSISSVVDIETGFVTRQGFQELLRHERDPNVSRKFFPSLLLFRAARDTDLVITAEILRNELRTGDLVAPLRNGLIAVLLQVPLELAADIRTRLLNRVANRLDKPMMRSALRSVEPSVSLRTLWTGMLREIQSQQS